MARSRPSIHQGFSVPGMSATHQYIIFGVFTARVALFFRDNLWHLWREHKGKAQTVEGQL